MIEKIQRIIPKLVLFGVFKIHCLFFYECRCGFQAQGKKKQKMLIQKNMIVMKKKKYVVRFLKEMRLRRC